MKSLHTFNGLNGATVTRNEIENLIYLAKSEEQTDVIYRLSKVLNDYPKSKEFDFEIDEPATEEVPKSFLRGLEYIYEPLENVGLGKAVSASEIYDMITKKMLDLISAANKGDYKRAWKEEGYTVPYNFISKKAYRGVNAFMLAPFFELLDNPYYLTFKQVKDLGGSVKKGSKGHEVVYFSTFDKKYTDAEIERINAVVENIDGAKSVEKGDSKSSFFLKYYNVFNGADIEGIDFDLDNFKLSGKLIPDTEIDGKDNQKLELAEAIVENYPAPKPPIYYQGSKAFYSPGKDSITVPKMTAFESSQSFYRTLLHELSHSTGHESRLKRDFSGKFGSKEYAFEELIAEFGAVFLSAQAGIMFYTNKNHAGYLKGWNEVLVPQLENDNKFLMKAASQAQKLADFVLQPDANGEFLFMKSKTKTVEKPTKTVRTPTKKVVVPIAKKPIVVKPILKKPILKKVIAPKKIIPKNKFEKNELVKVIYGECKNHIGKVKHCSYDQENGIFYYEVENACKDEISENNLAVATVLKTVAKKVVVSEPKLQDTKFKIGDSVQNGDFGIEAKVLSFRVNRNKKLIYKCKYIAPINEVFEAEERELQLFKEWKKEPKKEPIPAPKSFENKPKSVSIAAAIKDILGLQQYKSVSPLVATILFKYFKEKNEVEILEEVTVTYDYDESILKKQGRFHYLMGDDLQLTEIGAKFINSVNGRLESLHNQKNNYALFDGLKGIKNKIVNCSCGWKWNLKDGGLDPYICHKCGKNNALKPTKGLGMTLAEKRQQPQQAREYYKIDNRDISTFLGKIEKKNKESVVITLAGGQGSGKTRMLFQLMNAFAQNYKCGHASIEEHPESALYNDKVDKYLNARAQQNITSPEIENVSHLDNLIKNNDVIFIDSFAKLQEIENRFEVDKDLRKKYDGKLFVIIFQQTTDGKMRGGSKSQFDGDIILLTQPFPNYQDNYIYPNKNRYNSIPLDELKLNIYTGKLILKEVAKVATVNKFSFQVN